MSTDSKKIGLLMVGLLVSGLFVALGNWQLGRANDKTEALTRFTSRAQSPAVNLAEYNVRDIANAVGRSAFTNGVYRPRTTVLLDNQTLGGRIGYLVYTAYRIGLTDQHILVNRGWIAAYADPRRLPELGPEPINLTVSGRLSDPPAEGIRLRGAEIAESIDEGVWRVQRIDFLALAKLFDLEIIGSTLLLDNAMPNGFIRNWTPPGEDQARHLAYAFQWFALALAVFVISVGLFVRSKRHPHT